MTNVVRSLLANANSRLTRPPLQGEHQIEAQRTILFYCRGNLVIAYAQVQIAASREAGAHDQGVKPEVQRNA